MRIKKQLAAAPPPPSTDLNGLAERFKKRGYAPVVLPRKLTLSRAFYPTFKGGTLAVSSAERLRVVERVMHNDCSGSRKHRLQIAD